MHEQPGLRCRDLPDAFQKSQLNDHGIYRGDHSFLLFRCEVGKRIRQRIRLRIEDRLAGDAAGIVLLQSEDVLLQNEHSVRLEQASPCMSTTVLAHNYDVAGIRNSKCLGENKRGSVCNQRVQSSVLRSTRRTKLRAKPCPIVELHFQPPDRSHSIRHITVSPIG